MSIVWLLMVSESQVKIRNLLWKYCISPNNVRGNLILWHLQMGKLIKGDTIQVAPCWSVPEFWKIKVENSSSTNWIFSLQKSISNVIFAGYTGSKNPVLKRLKIQFIELDFSKLIFQKSSTDQQGERQEKYETICLSVYCT